MSPQVLNVLSIVLFAIAALLVGGVLLRQAWQFMRSEKVLNRRIDTHESQIEEAKPEGPFMRRCIAVSYTHLTLPTICSV